MAYALASRIERAVKKSGLEVVWVAGWKSRGRATMGTIQTITLHHTATPRSFKKGTEYPTYNVVKNGRSVLPGPLAQLGLGRTGTVYVFAAGRANHAGVSRATSMTNSHAIGIEAEGAMEAWPTSQYQAYLRLVRALIDEFGLGSSRALRHGETCSPPGRKTDASFSGPAFRKALTTTKTGSAPASTQPDTPAKPKGLFDMALKTADSRTEKQKVTRGKEITLRTRAKSTNKFLCSVKKGETVLVDEHVRISGLREGQVAEVWLRIGEYVAKTKKGHTRYNYPRVTVHGRAGGEDIHVAIPLVDKVGISPKHGGDLRLYVIVKNVSGDECVVESTKHHVLAD
ncbi:MAG: N-acetylmuramoyl-L-alanine amidase [Brevibacterium sp.]|nr:N-acetylmuramoyl-L-alanine amidase [Brevibacterium sp.]